jgi:hypothetical protein
MVPPAIFAQEKGGMKDEKGMMKDERGGITKDKMKAEKKGQAGTTDKMKMDEKKQ